MKYLTFLALLTALVNPQSIHYSSLGNYLVDENGQRTTIHGHPHMTCYRPNGELYGTFDKARGSTVWLKVPTIPPDGSLWYVKIPKAVCDLYE